MMLTLLLFITILFAQRPEYDRHEWTRKEGRQEMSDIVDGNYSKALNSLNFYLREYPGDPESLFLLTCLYSKKGDLNKASSYLTKSLAAGIPVRRFLAGPRDILEPLVGSKAFRDLLAEFNIKLIHGPRLGSVTATGARFWVRTVKPEQVQVSLSESPDMSNPVLSDTKFTGQEREYTAVVRVNGLEPGTRYYYRLSLSGEIRPGIWCFTTMPAKDKPARFSVGFGGGAAYTPEFEYMWNTISSHNLPAFLLLGDNVYIDNPTRTAVQQHCYYRRQSAPQYQDLSAATSVFAIWDDHDFTDNDGWGGPEIDTPAWKRRVWHTFKNNWINPYYGGGEQQPGCWFDFSIADVDFFMLDGRYYRTDPKTPNPSMLGPVQLQWLFDKLKRSTATFKVIASPVPWAHGTKPGSLDTWDGYVDERETIFSFLEENKINGVILLSADRHRSDAWRIERQNGYPLYEFESSRLTNIHLHKLMPGALFGYNDKCSFGKLSFDTTLPDPQVSYEVYSIDNELINKITIKKNNISF